MLLLCHTIELRGTRQQQLPSCGQRTQVEQHVSISSFYAQQKHSAIVLSIGPGEPRRVPSLHKNAESTGTITVNCRKVSG